MATSTITRRRMTGKGFIQNHLHVGSHPVLKKILLSAVGGKKIYGLVIPLKTEGDISRVDEVLDIMADAVVDFDPVPCGTMVTIQDTVERSTMKLNDPEIDRFDAAIPLRRAECRRNYFRWSKERHDWEILPFNLHNLRVESSNFMLIVQERQEKRR